MVFTDEQIATEVKNEMRGGKGAVYFRHIVSEERLGGHGRLFAQITLEPGNSIGYHEHHGESEIFYALSGQGTLSDNGVCVPFGAGQCALCPNGQGHALENTGNVPLVIIALILHHA